jgi:plastocyanin
MLLTTATLFGGAAQAADVSGRATYEGPPPERFVLRMNADPNCEKIHGETKVYSDDQLVGGNGELANVFFYLKGAPAAPAPSTAVELKQQGCLYIPHVQGVLAGQTIDIVNADPTLHNVRALARINRPFNLGQPAEGTRQKSFPKAEEHIKFKCDVHPWMNAYVFVMEHPYFAASDEKGRFAIANVPPGTYTLVAWHEVYGQQELEITVGAEGKSDVAFTFKPAP